MKSGLLQPRPHQVTALTGLRQALARHDRAQLVMACGTGKTLVGLWHAQQSGARQVLVLVPSLALVAQTLREWRHGSSTGGWPFAALVVCSDPTTAAGAAERFEDGSDADVPAGAWKKALAQVTTDPQAAAQFLRGQDCGRPQVVFSTYHSAPVVAAAQEASGAVFDVAICDEAHRLAGRPRAEFRTALDAGSIRSRKRILMTATPRKAIRINDLCMDDAAVFGPVAHALTFADAIDQGLLPDFRVLVAAVRAGDGTSPSEPEEVVPAAVMDAIDAFGVRRLLSFHSRVARAEQFAQALNAACTPGGRRVLARPVSGRMPTSHRVHTLQWLGADGLGSAGRDVVRLVASARCLTEGVNVPAVDAVIFTDQRTSDVEIAQAVGRCLRDAPGKTHGTVILPTVVRADADAESALAASQFGHVWATLQRLRGQGEEMAETSGWTARRVGLRRVGKQQVQLLEFRLPQEGNPPAVRLRPLERGGSVWDRSYELLHAWATANPGELLPRTAKLDDVAVGEWAAQQCAAYRRGTLPARRARRLEQIPGWVWDKSQARWNRTVQLLREFADRHGTVRDHDSGRSIFAGLTEAAPAKRDLGVWQAAQRQAYRQGTLPAPHARTLEAVADWAWDAHLPSGDITMVDALRRFVASHGHARVPDDHVQDGERLGAWCWAVRRRKLTGRLAPALEHEVLAATPARLRVADRFRWEAAETRWRLAYFALQQFHRREGHCRVARSHRELLPDATVNLGPWVIVQRQLRRRGELPGRHARLLEAVPTWQWDAATGTTRSPGGTQPPRLATALKHPTPIGRLRPYLLMLEACGAQRTTFNALSGVPLPVVSSVLDGTVTHIEREHQRLLRAITWPMVEKAQRKVGSQGREAAAHNELLDSQPTWDLLDDLAKRGFTLRWVSHELGRSGRLRRSQQITRRIADQVRDLHQRVGTLTMPPVRGTARRPSLTELRRQQQAA